MKLFFTHKGIALKKKRTALVVTGIGLIIGIYLIASRQPAQAPELPVVAIAPVMQDDVEIYGNPLSGHISERHVDLGTLVGPGSKSLLATIVKSDTVLVDFSMTALDYLKSKESRLRTGVLQL